MKQGRFKITNSKGDIISEGKGSYTLNSHASKVKPIFKVSSTKIVEDENGLTIIQIGKYSGKGTIKEFVDKCNKYL